MKRSCLSTCCRSVFDFVMQSFTLAKLEVWVTLEIMVCSAYVWRLTLKHVFGSVLWKISMSFRMTGTRYDSLHTTLCFSCIDIYTSGEVILGSPYSYWVEIDNLEAWFLTQHEVSIFPPLTLKVLKTISSEVNLHLLTKTKQKSLIPYNEITRKSFSYFREVWMHKK